MTFDRLVRERQERRKRDAERYAEHDMDLCMLCHAQGPDMRSLFLDCFYAIEEVIPEVIDLSHTPVLPVRQGYYLRICKACRGCLLSHLHQWRDERITLRDADKDSDGGLLYDQAIGLIPVRVNGAVVLMTQEEYVQFRIQQDRHERNGE